MSLGWPETIDELPRPWLQRIGNVVRIFDEQDSGNICYCLELDRCRYFVKTAGDPVNQAWFLSHSKRVELLHNASRIARVVQHCALPGYIARVISPTGPLLIYDWFDGDLVRVAAAQRSAPEGAYQRFRNQPFENLIGHLSTLFDVAENLAEAGLVTVDLYDGCLLWGARELRIIDLDNAHWGPSENDMGRMFGSSRFMAPEEFRRGAPIDQITNVFTLGRFLFEFVGDGSDRRSAFRGSNVMFEIAQQACQVNRDHRFDSVHSFVERWRATITL